MTAPKRRWDGWTRLVPASPGWIVLLWAVTTLLGIANMVVFPGDQPRWVSSILFLSGTSIFSGLAAGWLLRLSRRSTFHLMGALIALRLAARLASIILKFGTPASFYGYVDGIMGGLLLLATILVVYLAYGARPSKLHRVAAVLLVIGVNMAAGAMLNMDGAFWSLSTEVQALLGRAHAAKSTDNEPPAIDADILWGAQPALIEAVRAAIPPRAPGKVNVYAMAVAGSGEQALFSREAHEALRVAALHFGTDVRGGALLSNGAADLMHSPLATRASIAAVAQAIGDKADGKQDLLFLYLVSHGGRTAELESDLPDYSSVQPISSISTAAALRSAGVTRRVIVISACFAATWIPALADDNTIVITAAAKDRTSFGCDDSRRFTVFGEAFLGSLAARNISFHDAFEDAKRKISAEESKERVTPSLPQAYVGRNMQALWLGQAGGHPGG
jgi:hypothetical protein